jgi:hypothetical protein
VYCLCILYPGKKHFEEICKTNYSCKNWLKVHICSIQWKSSQCIQFNGENEGRWANGIDAHVYVCVHVHVSSSPSSTIYNMTHSLQPYGQFRPGLASSCRFRCSIKCASLYLRKVVGTEVEKIPKYSRSMIPLSQVHSLHS